MTRRADLRRVSAGFLGGLWAAICLPLSVNAADPPTPAPDQQLRQLDAEQRAQQAKQKQLDEQAAALEAELADLRGRLVNLAEALRASDETLAATETELAGLEGRESELLARLQADRSGVAHLLAALQRLARTPPEALIAAPRAPADLVRSALLLRSVIPQLQGRAAGLADQVRSLADVREALAAKRTQAEVNRKELASRQAEVTLLVARREALSRTTQVQRQETATRLAALAARAADLRELLEQVETERKAQREAKARQDAERRARQAAVAAAPPAPAKTPPKSTLKTDPRLGGLVLPVSGKVRTRYGENDSQGGASRGVVLEGRGGGTVVAPFDGTVAFAGPFKGYGLLLIVEHSNGYHSLIAGFGRIDAEPGQQLLTGEPVGVLEDTAKPGLYYELRRAGQPVNPLRGFAAGAAG